MMANILRRRNTTMKKKKPGLTESYLSWWKMNNLGSKVFISENEKFILALLNAFVIIGDAD